MGKSKIEWTDAVWNPVTGCTPISEGCKNCYAERMAKRLRGRAGYPADESFRVTLHPDRLDQPLHWRKPRRIFVCSMGDLFHEDVDFKFIAAVFGIMAVCPQHTFIILTKRPQIMKNFFDWTVNFDGKYAFYHPSNQLRACCDAAHHYAGYFYNTALFPSTDTPWPLPNVYLGVTAENQEQADKRIPILLQVPAAVRFVSVEPMLGPVNIEPFIEGTCLFCYGQGEVGPRTPCKSCNGTGEGGKLGWIVCGGESGPGARPIHPDWARKVRADCVAARLPFFFKQWGEYIPICQANETQSRGRIVCDGKHGNWHKVGKKAAGRELDGQVWNQMPGRVDNAGRAY